MKLHVLDYGYIELIETWGSDERIIESARMSTNKGFEGWGSPDKPGDEKLLAYLYKNRHMTPFEMAGATFEVNAPIMVYREWHRHRTQGYNEMSARYVPLPDVNYVPTLERIRSGVQVAAGNRQAQGTRPLNEEGVKLWLSRLQSYYDDGQRLYELGLEFGIPKELARLPVTVGRYSRMRATANLRNWMQFLELRSTGKNPHAQKEIREYADAMIIILKDKFPRTIELFKGE